MANHGLSLVVMSAALLVLLYPAGLLSSNPELKPLHFTSDTYARTVKIAYLPQSLSEKWPEESPPRLYCNKILEALQFYAPSKVLVISITGAYRSGKSFLLNLLTLYLEYYIQGRGNEWIGSQSLIEGIKWARGKDAVTHDMWMWKEPFILDRGGMKIAVLLIDCQGTGDTKKSGMQLDTLISYISASISTVQIFNLKTQMTSDDLTKIKLFTEFADYTNQHVNQSNDIGDQNKLFNRMILLQRNWEEDSEYGERPQEEFIDLVRTAIAPEVRRAGEGILNAYRRVQNFVLPHPGERVAKGSEVHYNCSKGLPCNSDVSVSKRHTIYDVTIQYLKQLLGIGSDKDGPLTVAHVNQEFLLAAKDLFDSLLDCHIDDLLSVEEFMLHIKRLNSRMEQEGPKILSPDGAFRDSVIYKAFDNAQRMLEEKVTEEMTENFLLKASREEIGVKMDEIWEHLNNYMERSAGRYKDSETFEKYLSNLRKDWKYGVINFQSLVDLREANARVREQEQRFEKAMREEEQEKEREELEKAREEQRRVREEAKRKREEENRERESNSWFSKLQSVFWIIVDKILDRLVRF